MVLYWMVTLIFDAKIYHEIKDRRTRPFKKAKI